MNLKHKDRRDLVNLCLPVEVVCGVVVVSVGVVTKVVDSLVYDVVVCGVVVVSVSVLTEVVDSVPTL